MSETDPEQYSNRDVLILAQLFHVNGLTDSKKLESSPDSVVLPILKEWKEHVSFKLEDRKIEIETRDQLHKLYSGLLEKHEAVNTIELANTVYYARMEDLESLLADYKGQFKEVLESTE